MNEEDVKVKIVVPILQAFGIDTQEMEFEKSFSLKVGRHTILETGKPTNGIAKPRLDILVRRGNRNLLIVETKASHLAISDDDRDQAVSYARLVHPIAPYALVTNGTNYRLYDAITKNEIDPSEIKIDNFQCALSDTAIEEAQRLFLSLSPSNLLTFCEAQVAGELRLVRGSLADGRKYVPELHTLRESIKTAVKEFYQSPLPGLLIVGQSGIGKTCELCSIAEWLLREGKPVLFFNSVALEKDILQTIYTEFSWTFNGSEDPTQLLKRIEALAGDQPITIIVDAIDEWMSEARTNHLSALLSGADGRNIKIILSCKTSAEEQFLRQRDTPTKISLLTKIIEIGAFSEQEFHKAIKNYSRAYEFYGAFEDTALKQARSNPFLLRVLFDVAKSTNVQHLTFDSPRLFEEYFQRSLRKTSDERQASDTLLAIASLMYDRNSDWVPEKDIRSTLGLRVNEPLMNELFEYSILLRNEGDNGVVAIGFYFQQLRDYIIAFKDRNFEAMDIDLITNEFNATTTPCTRLDVLTLYYRLASADRKVAFDGRLRSNAERYLELYKQLVQHYFPALKSSFSPHTESNIGFIGELLFNERRLGAYGFRAIGEREDNVLFVPVHTILGPSNLSHLHGAGELHWTGSSDGFDQGIDVPVEVIENELIPQIKDIIINGKLNESNNPDLLIESIIEGIHNNKEIFRLVLSKDQQSIQYPISLDSVREALYREKLTRHFHDELLEEKIERGEIKENWDGQYVSISYSSSDIDPDEVQDRVNRTLAEGKEIELRSYYVELEKLSSSIFIALDRLSMIRNEIPEPFPRKITPSRYGSPEENLQTKSDLAKYILHLYSSFITNYKSLVETNFPTLKNNFKTYSQPNLSVFIDIGRLATGEHGRRSTSLSVYFVEANPEKPFVKIIENPIVSRTENFLKISADSINYNIIRSKRTSVENLFETSNGLDGSSFRGMPLRSMVYRQILEELLDVLNVIRTERGIHLKK